MKKILLIILGIISNSFSQEFWEPAQLNFQVKQYSISKYAGKETDFIRRLDNRVIFSFSNSIKLNNFEFSLGAMTTESRNLTYQWGITYFYHGEGNSPFLSYSRSGNWMTDKWGKNYHYKLGTNFQGAAEREIYMFDVGYRFTQKNFSVQSSIGYIKGINSRAKMVAPTPQINFGIVYQVWRTRHLQEGDFK